MDFDDKTRLVTGKFGRALLATTCLTAASGVVSASTIVEGQPPAPSQFGTTFNSLYVLPPGTTEVEGTLTSGTDTESWFEFQGVGGSSFSLSATYNPLGEEAGFRMQLFTSSDAVYSYEASQTNAGVPSLEGGGTVLTGASPNDGIVVVEIFSAELGSFSNSPVGDYQVDLTATLNSATPEPSSLATVGLGLAGALAWRRKRTQKA